MKQIIIASILSLAWLGEAGDGNVIVGNGNVMKGNNNVLQGNNDNIYGNSNTQVGDFSSIFGNNNYHAGNNQQIIGNNQFVSTQSPGYNTFSQTQNPNPQKNLQSGLLTTQQAHTYYLTSEPSSTSGQPQTISQNSQQINDLSSGDYVTSDQTRDFLQSKRLYLMNTLQNKMRYKMSINNWQQP